MRQYEQLAQYERYLISALLQAGLSQREIALILGRAASTISRELGRNSTTHDGWYRPSKAHRYAMTRRSRSRRGVKFKPRDYEVVRSYLAQKWSPQQISARLVRSGELDMSHESIYQFIRRDRSSGGNLFRHCRILPKKGRKLRGKPERRGIQAGKRHISERPASVELRLRTGHWEGDTVIGQDKRHSLLTLVERKTGYAVIKKIKARNSEQTIAATLAALKEHGKKMKTLTFDNGTEFHDYKKLEAAHPVKCYFATPYHSWERGTNENLNGLIRQYLPKGMCFSSVDQAQCDWIAHQLNTRPRKRLGYLTPEECYERP